MQNASREISEYLRTGMTSQGGNVSRYRFIYRIEKPGKTPSGIRYVYGVNFNIKIKNRIRTILEKYAIPLETFPVELESPKTKTFYFHTLEEAETFLIQLYAKVGVGAESLLLPETRISDYEAAQILMDMSERRR